MCKSVEMESGMNPCFCSRNCIAKPETASPMSHIEDHASCAGFCDGGIELAVGKDDRKLLGEDMGVNVARPHFLEYQVLISSLWPRPEIKHDRTICENAALNRTVNRSPGSVFSIPRPPGPVMGGFYSHDEVGILLDGVDTKFHIHFVQALFKPTVHAICHDVQEGQHSYSGAVDDFFLFLKKRLRPGGACIHDGGHAGLQCHISRNSKWQRMCSRVGREPVQRRPAMTDMVVNIDEPGRYIEIRDIHNLPGLIRRNVFLDGSNFALENTDVSYLIDVIRRVNHMAALQQQVVTLARLSKYRE